MRWKVLELSWLIARSANGGGDSPQLFEAGAIVESDIEGPTPNLEPLDEAARASVDRWQATEAAKVDALSAAITARDTAAAKAAARVAERAR